jgi:cation diffusion facilitator CzcD-associated flavoprotein CzcO
MGDKAEAFFGMAVAGFPNLFLINGPNTGLGHNSMIYMAECGGMLAAACIFTSQYVWLRGFITMAATLA